MATTDTEHYLRLHLLNVDGGGPVLRELVNVVQRSSAKGSLFDYLQCFKAHITTNPGGKKYYEQLFPDDGNVDTSQWDITLLCFVVIAVCTLEGKLVLDLKKIFLQEINSRPEHHKTLYSFLLTEKHRIDALKGTTISDEQYDKLFPSIGAPLALEKWDDDLLTCILSCTNSLRKVRDKLKECIKREAAVYDHSGDLDGFLASSKRRNTLDNLRKSGKLTDAQLKQVYPQVACANNVTGKTNIDAWDYTVLCMVALNVTETLTNTTVDAVNVIKKSRNTISHRSNIDINSDDFREIWTDLFGAIHIILAIEVPEIKSEVMERIDKFKNGPLDIAWAIQVLKDWYQKDQLVNESILLKLQKMEESNTSRLLMTEQNIKDHVDTKIEEVLNKLTEMSRSGYAVTIEELRVKVTILCDDEETGTLIQHFIIEAAKAAKEGPVVDSDHPIKDAINDFITFLQQKASVNDARVGSVIILIQCRSFGSLLDLLQSYLKGNLQESLDNIADVVMSTSGVKVSISASFYDEDLQNAVEDIEQQFVMERVSYAGTSRSSVEICLQATGTEELEHIVKFFTTADSLRKLSEELTEKTGTKVELLPSLNLHAVTKTLHSIHRSEELELSEEITEKSGKKGKRVTSPDFPTSTIGKKIKTFDNRLVNLQNRFECTLARNVPENFNPPPEISDIRAKLQQHHRVVVAGFDNARHLETALMAVKNIAKNIKRCVEVHDAQEWSHVCCDDVDLVVFVDPFGKERYDLTRAKAMADNFDRILEVTKMTDDNERIDIVFVSQHTILQECLIDHEHEVLDQVVIVKQTTFQEPVNLTKLRTQRAETADPVLLNLQGHSAVYIKHKGRDFHNEQLLSQAREIFKQHKMILITGPRRSGKTTLAVNLMSAYKNEHCLVMITPSQWHNAGLGEVSVLLIEDFAGKYKLDIHKAAEWYTIFDIIFAAVMEKKLNVIVTCEEGKLAECIKEMSGHDLLIHTISLSDQEIPGPVVKTEPGSPQGSIDTGHSAVYIQHKGRDFHNEQLLSQAREIFKQHKMILITGPRRSGKTTLAVNLMSAYQNEHCLVMITPSQWQNVKLGDVSVLLIEEFAGKYKLDIHKAAEWYTIFDMIYAAVMERKLNVIVTCEEEKLSKCFEEMSGHDLLINTISLADQEIPGPGTPAAGDQTNTQLQHRPYTATHAGDFSVKTNDDTGVCGIRGSCMLQDGSLLLADYNNKKLKRLDSLYRVIDVCDMDGYPWNVCCISATEVAVSTGRLDMRIEFVSVSVKLTRTRSIQLEHVCRGLVSSSGELYVCGDRHSIHVYSTAGLRLRTIDVSEYGDHFDYNNIAVSYDGSQIYVCKANSLVCLDKQGQLVWKYTDDDLRYYRRVCVGNDNNVFVSDCKSVLQISPSGQKIVVILQEADRDKDISSICYDRRQSRLIVAFFNCDHIKVFYLTM